jgi:hypothetical protein
VRVWQCSCVRQCSWQCAAVCLVVCGSARGCVVVQLCAAVLMAVCGSVLGSVRQCAWLCGSAAVCDIARGSVWRQCGQQCVAVHMVVCVQCASQQRACDRDLG